MSQLGESILAFLESMLEKRDPDRDVPAGEALSREIRAACDCAASVDAVRVVTGLLVPVVTRLKSQPTKWPGAVGLASLYLHVEDRKPDVASTLASDLLAANPAGAEQFFSSTDDWNVFHALEPVLPQIALDQQGAIAMLNRYVGGTRGRVLGFIPATVVVSWAERNAAQSKELTEAWLGGAPATRELAPEAIQFLVEGVVRAPSIPAAIRVEWREATLRCLFARSDEFSWRLATYLACFAWPTPNHPVWERHQSLLSYVGQRPRQVAEAGLEALKRDAREHPAEAMLSLSDIWRLLHPAGVPPQDLERLRMGAAQVVLQVLVGESEKGARIDGVEEFLPELFEIPPGTGNHIMDLVLDSLRSGRNYDPRDVLRTWLIRHGTTIRASHVGLADEFPVLVHHAGPEMVGNWLVQWLVDSDADLRWTTVSFLSNHLAPRLSMSAIESLPAKHVQALSAELVGCGLNGDCYTRILLSISDVRVDVLPHILQLLVEDAVEDYPGACRGILDAIAAKAGVTPQAGEIQAVLRTALEAREAAREYRAKVPELFSTSPAWAHWMDLQDRIFARARANAPASAFEQLAVKQPIARGEGTVGRGMSPPVQFQHFECVVELPVRAVLDPVAHRIALAGRRLSADRLLANDEQVGDP